MSSDKLSYCWLTDRVANIAFQNIWEVREVSNVRVTADHRPTQAQKEPGAAFVK